MRTKKIVRVYEVMRRSFNCLNSSSTRLRTALDESKLASLKIPHEVVKRLASQRYFHVTTMN